MLGNSAMVSSQHASLPQASVPSLSSVKNRIHYPDTICKLAHIYALSSLIPVNSREAIHPSIHKGPSLYGCYGALQMTFFSYLASDLSSSFCQPRNNKTNKKIQKYYMGRHKRCFSSLKKNSLKDNCLKQQQ